MDCLSNLIGIKGECGIIKTSSASLYINDLSGITTRILDKVKDEDYFSTIELIESKIQMASGIIASTMNAQFQPSLRQNSIIASDRVGFYTGSLRVLTNMRRGIRIKVQNAPYIQLSLPEVTFLAGFDGTDVVFDVWDLTLGIKLKSFTYAEVTVDTPIVANLNFIMDSKSSYIDIAIIPELGSPIQVNSTVQNTNGKHVCGSCARTTQYSYIAGVMFNPTDPINSSTALTNSNGTGGLSVVYSLNCSSKNFVCSLGGAVAMPLLYKTGSLLMEEATYSRRLNSVITVGANLNQAMQTHFEGEFSATMSSLMQNIKPPQDVCFTCTPKVGKQVQIP